MCPPLRLCYLVLALLALSSTGVGATERQVELPLASGVVATASYSEGGGQARPVLILHGFLQTQNFFTVKRLHDSLSGDDYHLLSPTLSLGIDRRAQSLGCEAMHLHALDDDVEEVRQWVTWLHQRHGKPVVLIGHSAGGLVLTRYMQAFPQAPVEQAILISLSDLRGAALSEPAAGSGAASDDQALTHFQLGFCQRYLSTPAAFRSYRDWNALRVLAVLQQSASRVAVILGSADDRIAPAWRQQLISGGVRIVEVEGADHFFDSAHEFDLLDAVESLLAP